MKQWYRTVIFAISAILLLIIIRWFGISNSITLESIKIHGEYFKSVVHDHYVLSVITFMATLTTIVALTIPLSILFTLLSGFLFGPLLGALYAIVSATLGATIAFLFIRYVFHSAFSTRYDLHCSRFNEEIQRRGIYYILFLQLLPITPFALVTLLSALSDISVFTFSFATFFGIMPSSLLYAYAGKELLSVEHLSDILSPQFVVLLCILALLALSPIIAHYLHTKFRKS
jgi:uncharacterized membrane protein YdjX (TVP38/TMEM64 family)